MKKKFVTGRRGFLKVTGAVTVIVAGGTVWRAYDQGVFSTGQGPAYEPWETWRTDTTDGSLSLVRAAILAASPHNTQPWHFSVSPSQINLFADTSRNIGAIDPDRREMYMGLGCALENLLLAAKANGYDYRLRLMPDSTDPTHVAQVDLTVGKPETSDLYQAVPRRHTNRGPYDTSRSITPEVLKTIQELGIDMPDVTVFWFVSDQERSRVGDLIVQATKAIIADKQQTAASAKWMRQTWQDIQRYRDGITYDAQIPSAFLRAVVKILPPLPQDQFDDAWLKATKETHVATAAAFGIIAVRDSKDRAQRLHGGRWWQRAHLWATTQGIAMHPLNQMPERADRESSEGIEAKFGNALKELIGDTNWQALMPFRMGYPLIESLRSPRRSVEDVIV
jgi:hypothetical protein